MVTLLPLNEYYEREQSTIIAMILIIYKSHVNAGKFTWLLSWTNTVHPDSYIYILEKLPKGAYVRETTFKHPATAANHPLQI